MPKQAFLSDAIPHSHEALVPHSGLRDLPPSIAGLHCLQYRRVAVQRNRRGSGDNQLAARHCHWRRNAEMDCTAPTFCFGRIQLPVNGAHVSALATQYHLLQPSVLLQRTLAIVSSPNHALLELGALTMTRSSTICLGCDPAMWPAKAVCIYTCV